MKLSEECDACMSIASERADSWMEAEEYFEGSFSEGTGLRRTTAQQRMELYAWIVWVASLRKYFLIESKSGNKNRMDSLSSSM